MALRHRSRHLRATIFDKVKTDLTTLGWVHAPINFDTTAVTVIDYQPDERQEPVKTNTVAVSLGDVVNDVDEELGAQAGGLRSALYPVFVDVYMAEQALADAICDDLRDIFDEAIFPLVNQIDGSDSGERIEIELVIGPDRPAGLNAADPFKRYWRVMRLGARLYYQGGSTTPTTSIAFALAGGGGASSNARTARVRSFSSSGGGSQSSGGAAHRLGSVGISGGGGLAATGVASSAFVRITTTGASFNPTVELVSGSAATVHWFVEETAATTTGVNPTISFGSTGTRHVRMTVTNGAADAIGDVVTFNVGYDHNQDPSQDALAASYDKASQSVTGLENVRAMTGLVRFAAANNPGLNHAIDFTGMAALTNIECYASQITGVTLTGCSSLLRLCIEINAITNLDLNPVAATLRDLRAAIMTGPSLTLATLTSNLANLWHFCVRDQVVINIPPASRLPVVQQLWIWNTSQSGALTVSSSAAQDIRAYANAYTSATLTGCTNVNYVDLHQNNLTQAAVDNVLTTVNGFGTSNGTLALAVNAAPSATGSAARTSLLGRGWTVFVETADGVHSDDFERADATGLAAVGNGWTTTGSANANIVSGDLVRTDSASYQLLINPAAHDLPADYTVTASIPAATIGAYFGLVGRWNGSEGVTAFFDANATFANLHLRSASNYGIGELALTADNAFPASWSSGTGDHTFAMKMIGTRIEVYLDGTLVAHGTSTVNATATGTGYGISGEGNNRHWHSIGAIQQVTGAFTLSGGGALAFSGAAGGSGSFTAPVGSRFSSGQDLAYLQGPSSPPAGAVTVTAGAGAGNTIDALTASHAAGTTFWLAPGRHLLAGTSAFDQIQPKAGNTYIGAPGAYIDGQGVNRYATTGTASGVTFSTLRVTGFVPPFDEFVLNHDTADNFTVYGCEIDHNDGAGLGLGSGNVVTYSWLHDNRQYGFSSFNSGVDGANAVQYVTVDHCEISGNGDINDEIDPITGDYTFAGRNGGGKFWDTYGITVTNCWVHHNDWAGLWADTNNAVALIADNLIEYNAAEGIIYEISFNFSITRNVIRGNNYTRGVRDKLESFPRPGVYISESGGNSAISSTYATSEISHNQFIDNWDPLCIFESSDRFFNSPSNTSGQFYAPPGATLAKCNNPAVKTLTCNTTSGSATVTVTSGLVESTDAGRPVSGTGIPVGTHVVGPTAANGFATGYIDGNHFTMDHAATATATGVTLTFAAGTIAGADYDVCRWEAANIDVHHNTFSHNAVRASNGTDMTGAQNGRVAIISQFGTYPAWSPYMGTAIENVIATSRNNTFHDNTYRGGIVFEAKDTGSYLTSTAWRAVPQDVSGSTFDPTEPP